MRGAPDSSPCQRKSARKPLAPVKVGERTWAGGVFDDICDSLEALEACSKTSGHVTVLASQVAPVHAKPQNFLLSWARDSWISWVPLALDFGIGYLLEEPPGY